MSLILERLAANNRYFVSQATTRLPYHLLPRQCNYTPAWQGWLSSIRSPLTWETISQYYCSFEITLFFTPSEPIISHLF